MAQEPVIRIWPGSGSFCPGLTPFGTFDTDPRFIIDADRTAKWCAHRLGYPITDIELQDVNFYTAFEQSVLDYSHYVNMYSAKDTMLSLKGQPTASLNLQNQYIPPNLSGIFKLSSAYATAAGIGGELIHYSGSVNVTTNKQVYDLDSGTVNLEKGDFQSDNYTIRRIFHEDPGLATRTVNGASGQGILNEFGWGDMAIGYTLMPLDYDVMRMQAIEMHSQIRKSGYSFHMSGNRLRIFPIPKNDMKLFFHYTLDSELVQASEDGSIGLETGNITDISNIPYQNKTYSYINDIGKNWIRRYALALTKEMLGLVRSKYGSIPIPDNEITLNGPELINSAQDDISNLIEELKETLDSMTQQAQLERKQSESDALSSQLTKVPMKIYVK